MIGSSVELFLHFKNTIALKEVCAIYNKDFVDAGQVGSWLAEQCMWASATRWLD